MPMSGKMAVNAGCARNGASRGLSMNLRTESSSSRTSRSLMSLTKFWNKLSIHFATIKLKFLAKKMYKR